MKHNVLTLIIYTVLQWTWGIIQNICGLALWLWLAVTMPGHKSRYYHGAIIRPWRSRSSMGLGMFIFNGHGDSPDVDKVIVHEYGHTVQSVILGPLFLPVIGIPSLTWASTPVFVKWRKEGKYNYCDFYPEKWANKVGERVTRCPAIWK